MSRVLVYGMPSRSDGIPGVSLTFSSEGSSLGLRGRWERQDGSKDPRVPCLGSTHHGWVPPTGTLPGLTQDGTRSVHAESEKSDISFYVCPRVSESLVLHTDSGR